MFESIYKNNKKKFVFFSFDIKIKQTRTLKLNHYKIYFQIGHGKFKHV